MLGFELLAGLSCATVGNWPTAALLKALSKDLLAMVQASYSSVVRPTRRLELYRGLFPLQRLAMHYAIVYGCDIG